MFRFFRHRWARAGLFAVPVILFGSFAWAGIGGWHGCQRPETPEQALAMATPLLDDVAADLALTPEQRQSVEAILGDAVREGFDVHAQGKDLRERFAQAMADGADEDTLEALRVEATALFDQGSRVAVDRLAEVRRVLTPEQWAQLKARHKSRWGHRPW